MKKLFRPVKAEKRTGFCLCGCGEKTTIAEYNRPERGDKAGFPIRYLSGHNSKDPLWIKKLKVWTSKTNWNGGKTIHQGYILRHRRTFTKNEFRLLQPMFKNYHKNERYIPEHRAIIALELGRILKRTEFVRHLDGNKQNNKRENLLLGSAKDNYLDHNSARILVIKLRAENERLKEVIIRLHGKDGKEIYKISQKELRSKVK